MNLNFEYSKDKINLYVEGRISKSDANRQMKTARAILNRLKKGSIIKDFGESLSGKGYFEVVDSL